MGRYLADDWVICNKQGHLEIFPKSINIEPYNFKNLKVLDLNIPEIETFTKLEQLINSSKYFDDVSKNEILSNAQVFVPHQLLDHCDEFEERSTFSVSNIFWLNRVHNAKKPVSLKNVNGRDIISHIQSTRKLEHYPFELIKSVMPGLQNENIKLSDEVEFDALNNLITSNPVCYKVDLLNQNATSCLIKTIIELVEK